VLHDNIMVIPHSPKYSREKPKCVRINLESNVVSLVVSVGIEFIGTPKYSSSYGSSLILKYDKYMLLLGGYSNNENVIWTCDCETLEWTSRRFTKVSMGWTIYRENMPGVVWGDKLIVFGMDYFSYDFKTHEEQKFDLLHPKTGEIVRFVNVYTKLTVLNDEIFGFGVTEETGSPTRLFVIDPISYLMNYLEFSNNDIFEELSEIGTGFAFHADETRRRLIIYGGDSNYSRGQSNMYLISIGRSLNEQLWKMLLNLRGCDLIVKFE
jgi:hypothetical protein